MEQIIIILNMIKALDCVISKQKTQEWPADVKAHPHMWRPSPIRCSAREPTNSPTMLNYTLACRRPNQTNRTGNASLINNWSFWKTHTHTNICGDERGVSYWSKYYIDLKVEFSFFFDKWVLKKAQKYVHFYEICCYSI
jgi:hypothetical protein